MCFDYTHTPLLLVTPRITPSPPHPLTSLYVFAWALSLLSCSLTHSKSPVCTATYSWMQAMGWSLLDLLEACPERKQTLSPPQKPSAVNSFSWEGGCEPLPLLLECCLAWSCADGPQLLYRRRCFTPPSLSSGSKNLSTRLPPCRDINVPFVTEHSTDTHSVLWLVTQHFLTVKYDCSYCGHINGHKLRNFIALPCISSLVLQEPSGRYRMWL